jgi:hypothetical protein
MLCGLNLSPDELQQVCDALRSIHQQQAKGDGAVALFVGARARETAIAAASLSGALSVDVVGTTTALSALSKDLAAALVDDGCVHFLSLPGKLPAALLDDDLRFKTRSLDEHRASKSACAVLLLDSAVVTSGDAAVSHETRLHLSNKAMSAVFVATRFWDDSSWPEALKKFVGSKPLVFKTSVTPARSIAELPVERVQMPMQKFPEQHQQLLRDFLAKKDVKLEDAANMHTVLSYGWTGHFLSTRFNNFIFVTESNLQHDYVKRMVTRVQQKDPRFRNVAAAFYAKKDLFSGKASVSAVSVANTCILFPYRFLSQTDEQWVLDLFARDATTHTLSYQFFDKEEFFSSPEEFKDLLRSLYRMN